MISFGPESDKRPREKRKSENVTFLADKCESFGCELELGTAENTKTRLRASSTTLNWYQLIQLNRSSTLCSYVFPHTNHSPSSSYFHFRAISLPSYLTYE